MEIAVLFDGSFGICSEILYFSSSVDILGIIKSLFVFNPPEFLIASIKDWLTFNNVMFIKYNL